MKKSELVQLIKEVINEDNSSESIKDVIAHYFLVNKKPLDFDAKQKYQELNQLVNWFEIYSKKLQLDESLIITFKTEMHKLIQEFIEVVNQNK